MALLVTMGSIVAGPVPAKAASEFVYVTMSDGAKIAIQVFYPPTFSPSDHAVWPAVLAMDGYNGARDPVATSGFADEYVRVAGSVRGTGCSGGKFDLLSWRTAMDGYEIIENWIAAQPWSNGKVGIIGHSYPGLTGYQIAALAPPHLRATAVSGLIDDFYRGIFYPGGVANAGFPLLWEVALRPAVDWHASARRMSSGDPQCLQNIESRKQWNFLQHENIIEVYGEPEATEGSWSIRSALMRFTHQISAPLQIEQQYQDDQTGPRGGHVLFENLPANVPSRLIQSNGEHGSTTDAVDPTAKKGWLDCWILRDGQGCGTVSDPSKRVVTYFERKATEPRTVEPYYSSDWPLPETSWTRYFLRTDGTLSADVSGGDGERSYVSGATGRQFGAAPRGATDVVGEGTLIKSVGGVGAVTFVDGPDTLRYELSFDRPTAIAGPIALSLWARSTSVDTDFFADLLDLNTQTGEVSYLQRGILRASHRAIDLDRSDRVRFGQAAGTVYRYWHPHVDPKQIAPYETNRYEIEIFPVGHVFREGHKLVLNIHAPPANDAISIWTFAPQNPPGINTVVQGPGARSTLLLPVMPVLPPIWDVAPGCGDLEAIPCFTPPV